MDDVVVLGLGRMGRAMAERYAAAGLGVSTWSRRGGGTAASAEDAAAAGGPVVLALYDARACAAVMGDVLATALGPGRLVVNTATVGPDEAVALAASAEAHGTRYVQAPVMGSVPAVLAGELRVLAGGADADVAEAAKLLAPLAGEVRHVGTVADAATAKLVANGSLAASFLALRGVLEAAAGAGLPTDEALDVLELGRLGDVARAARARRDNPASAATFTAGALAKDMHLLARASGHDELAQAVDAALAAGVGPNDDAMMLALPSPALEPLENYARGHATGDVDHFRRAFLPTAHVEGLRDGTFRSMDLDAYFALFDGTPAPDEDTRTRTVDDVQVSGSVATATMTLRHGETTFTDMFVLLRGDDGWRIANKVYHRH